MELIVKNSFKFITLSILIFFSSQNIAVTVDDAISASKSSDAIKAAKLWSLLANSGNSIAKFNIANHYKSGQGVKKNKALADQWLKDATRSGLIQAYLN